MPARTFARDGVKVCGLLTRRTRRLGALDNRFGQWVFRSALQRSSQR
jgi:hypothetical protein